MTIDDAVREAFETLRLRLDSWGLTSIGECFRSQSSWLQPVRLGDVRAMLKVPFEEEEKRAIPVLSWFAGQGAARVIRSDVAALLLELLPNAVPLTAMAEAERDDDATRILCRVVAALHRPRSKAPLSAFIPIRRRFRSLEMMAVQPGPHRSLLAEAWSNADWLIANSAGATALHGDIHHGNVLQDTDGVWRAIDPKGVTGPRGYDYANILCNPNPGLAERPGRFRAQARVIAEESGLAPREVMGWGFVHAALSACWSMETGPWLSAKEARDSLAVAEIARAEFLKA